MHAKFFVAAASLLLAQIAGASEPGDDFDLFVGGDSAASIFQGTEHPPGTRVDDVDFSWSLYGGARYKWVGLSGGYVDFGEVHVRAPGFRDRVAYRAATVSAFLFIPVNEDLRIYGEVGALFWQQKMNFEDTLGSFDAKKDEVSLLLGVGASYRIRHTPLSLTARYDHYFEVGALRRTGHDNDIDRIALGVAWVF